MDVANLHEILRELYSEMMPLCSDMAGIAKGLAGLGALFYVAMRVWSSLARAEPIDVYPLLRPFALGICILFFSDRRIGRYQRIALTGGARLPFDSGSAVFRTCKNIKRKGTNWNMKP